MTPSSTADPVLPFVAFDPMQAVVESDGARELGEQLAQERLDAIWERTPAGERSLWPPTYFPPDNSSEPALPLSTGSLWEDA